jgi:hypothetical protein
MHPLKTMSPTQYICLPSDGMCLRSGRTINNFATSDLCKDLNKLTTGRPYYYAHSFNSSDPNTFCDTCFKVFGLLNIAEKYGKELRGETNDIKGDDNKFTIKQKFYVAVRIKINDFISNLENNTFKPCICQFPSYNSSDFDDQEAIIADNQYSHMSNYTGYGPERALYRQYHRNFIKILDNECDRVWWGAHRGDIDVIRDFNKMKEELIHWSTFFNQEHCWVIEQEKQMQMRIKAAKKIRNINEDCLNHVLSFVH